MEASIENRVTKIEGDVEEIKDLLDIRPCKCGCGRNIQGRVDQKYATKACRQRAYRNRNPKNDSTAD